MTPENIAAIQNVAIENQEQGESERLARRQERIEDRVNVSRKIANITRAIADVGHSDALLKDLKALEGELAVIKKDLEQLDVPIEPVPHLTQPQIVAASTKLIERLHSSSLEERKQALRGIVAEVRAERVGKQIFALITYYFPMLPMSLSPMGAQLHRQLFSYPAEWQPKTRSK